MSERRLSLWSRRYSVARGWHWAHERYVAEETATFWLRTFQADEPAVEFVNAVARPFERTA